MPRQFFFAHCSPFFPTPDKICTINDRRANKMDLLACFRSKLASKCKQLCIYMYTANRNEATTSRTFGGISLYRLQSNHCQARQSTHRRAWAQRPSSPSACVNGLLGHDQCTLGRLGRKMIRGGAIFLTERPASIWPCKEGRSESRWQARGSRPRVDRRAILPCLPGAASLIRAAGEESA